MAKSKITITKNIVGIGGTSKGVIIPIEWFDWLEIDAEKDKLNLELNTRTGAIKITKAE